MSDQFVNLHCHTMSSAFDGLGSEQAFADRAAELGQPAIGLTEHGSIRGIYEAHLACKAAGIKYVPGVECYLVDDALRRGLTDDEKAAVKRDHPEKDDQKAALTAAEKEIRDRDHLTVWAMNDVGIHNLYRLTHRSWTTGFYYKPRVQIEDVIEFGDGLLVSSGCPNGAVASPIRSGKVDVALRRAQQLSEAFGDRFYVEIMPHLVENGHALARKLVRIADRVRAKIIATQDAHYPRAEDSVAQEVLLAIQTRSTMTNPDRFRFTTRDFWLRSRAEMETAFLISYPDLDGRIVKQALDETVAFADRVNVEIPLARSGAYLVAPDLPAGIAHYNSWLINECGKGSISRFGRPIHELDSIYKDRLLHELRTIRDMNFSAYFIMVQDMIDWARSQGIKIGPGRGSAAGSLIAYLLRITDLDPVKYGLMFERMLAPGRKDLPDVDTDAQHDRRDEVIEYLRRKYGEDRVARISSRVILGGKGALQDLARVYEIPIKDVTPVSGLIVNAIAEEDQSETSLTEVLNETEAGKVFRDRYPDVAAVAGKIEGNLRTVGVHAAGVIVSSVPIVEVAPVETMAIRGGPRVPVVALDMRAAEAVGLVKIDVLPLKTLTVLAKAEQLSGVLCETIDPEDPDTLQAFTDQRFVGVFQFDSAGSRRICQGFMFRQFSDIAAITALNRPGPMETGMARIYVERSNGTARVESVHPIYDEVFKDTYGVPIYQEQVINLAKAVGYTPEEADKFRKKIAKKIGLADERPKFVAGAVAAGMDDDLAERIFNDLLGFASYAFNASHSYAYSCIAQWTMWYKVHHPAAFYAALLAVEDSETTQLRIAADARRSGIRVEPPDLQTSEARFALRVDPTGAPVIVGSTADLHGVGPATAKAIADNAPYTDLLDLYRRTAGRGIRVTSATFRILAASTALRSLCPGVPIRLLVENAKPIWESLRRGVLPVFNVPSPIPDYDPEALTKIASEVYPIYVDAKGHSAVDDVVDRLRRSCSRSILTPSEVDQTSPWIGFVAGLFTRIKLFPGESGKTGMAVIGSTDGSEIVARIDTDVLDACSRVLATVNQIVVAAVSVSDRGRIGLESIWPVEEILTPGSDPLRRFVAAPPRTTPRDPRLTIQKLDEDQKTWIEGIVIRIRKGKDKNGGNLRSLTIVGERGAIKVMVFASRLHRDITSIEVGRFVEMRVQKMRGDLVFLSEAEIKTVSDPWGANP